MITPRLILFAVATLGAAFTTTASGQNIPPAQIVSSCNELTVTVPTSDGPAVVSLVETDPTAVQLNIDEESGLTVEAPNAGTITVAIRPALVTVVVNGRLLPISMDPLPATPVRYTLKLPAKGKVSLTRNRAAGPHAVRLVIVGAGSTFTATPVTSQTTTQRSRKSN
jgi:hypothetical protein